MQIAAKSPKASQQPERASRTKTKRALVVQNVFTVVYRIQLSNLSKSVLGKIVNSDFLKERHCLELLELSTVDIFSHETLLCEIIDNVTKRSKEPTSAQFKAEVSKYNDAIKAAETCAKQLKGVRFASSKTIRAQGAKMAMDTLKTVHFFCSVFSRF